MAEEKKKIIAIEGEYLKEEVILALEFAEKEFPRQLTYLETSNARSKSKF